MGLTTGANFLRLILGANFLGLVSLVLLLLAYFLVITPWGLLQGAELLRLTALDDFLGLMFCR